MNSAARKLQRRRALRAALAELAGGLATIGAVAFYLWLWLTGPLP